MSAVTCHVCEGACRVAVYRGATWTDDGLDTEACPRCYGEGLVAPECDSDDCDSDAVETLPDGCQFCRRCLPDAKRYRLENDEGRVPFGQVASRGTIPDGPRLRDAVHDTIPAPAPEGCKEVA